MKNKTFKVIISVILVAVIISFIAPQKPIDPIEQAKQTLEKDTERLRKQNEEKREELLEMLTPEQRNALEMAENYLEFASFSRVGLSEQLQYEGFTYDEANFAVATLLVDWEEQAYLKAVEYLRFSNFSRQKLIEQLEYEGFTHSEAEYGVDKAYK